MHVVYIIVAGVLMVTLTMSAHMKLVHDRLAVEVIGAWSGFRCACSLCSRCWKSQAVWSCWSVSR